MTIVARAAAQSFDAYSILHQAPVHAIAGEDIPPCTPCYLHTDKKVYRCDGAAADAKAKVAGWNLKDIKTGEPVELFGIGTKMYYTDTGLTVGSILYLGATAGRLDTATTTGDGVGVAQVLADGKTIRVTRAI